MAYLGRYEIIAELGRGGMAQVYHAHDPQFDRDVAIKVLPREFLHDPTFLARFQREARALAALQHKGIVPVYDMGDEDGQPFLVMAYMSGGSLADRIKAGPIPLVETTRIIEQVGSALDHAHVQGMIHRDIKPENILFDSFGDAHLSDFGIVRISEATAQLTGAGILGTPAYLAPEMADNAEPSNRVDIYALGVTLFYMLAGKLPYEASTPIGLLTAHVTKPIPDIRTTNPLLPPGIQRVIERSIAKDPAERYPSAADMLADLRRVAEGDFANTIDVATVSNIQTPLPHATSAASARATMPIASKPAPLRSSSGGVGRIVLALGGIGVLALIAFGVFTVFLKPKAAAAPEEEPARNSETSSTSDTTEEPASAPEPPAGAASGETVVVLVNANCEIPAVSQADEVILRMRWGTTSEEYLLDNIPLTHPILSLDGEHLGDITRYEQPSEVYISQDRYGCGSDNEAWFVHWDVPVGRLGVGTHIIGFNYEFAQDVYDGFDTYPAGLLFEDDVEFWFDVTD